MAELLRVRREILLPCGDYPACVGRMLAEGGSDDEEIFVLAGLLAVLPPGHGPIRLFASPHIRLIIPTCRTIPQ